MKRDLKETKDEISSVKELVLDMSRDLTRGMGEMKDAMGEMKREIAANKEECHRSKREPESDVHSLGASSACFQPSINIREQRMRTSSLIREDILIAGGYLLTSVEMFSWTIRQWTLLSPMTSQRFLSSSFVDEDEMFICGGMESEDTMESLEMKKEGAVWEETQAKLPQETWGHASIVYNEHVYVFGGQSDAKVVSNIYKVSLVSPLYSSQLICDLPKPRCYHGAQRFGDQVAIVGGTTTGGSSDSLDSVLLYDITRNCCRTLAPLPFAVSRMATVALGDNIIIIGGCDKNDNKLNTVVSYNITNENSTMLPSMKQKRSHCAAVITGNVIVVMGGGDEKRNILNSVESFSFDRYSWEELPPMNEKRIAATAIVKSLS